jgi:hypothetical protein
MPCVRMTHLTIPGYMTGKIAEGPLSKRRREMCRIFNDACIAVIRDGEPGSKYFETSQSAY